MYDFRIPEIRIPETMGEIIGLGIFLGVVRLILMFSG